MKLNKKREKIIIKSLVILIILVSILILSFSVYSITNAPIEVKKYDTVFIVGKGAGFDLNTTILTFGRVPSPGEAERKLFIENIHDFPVNVKVFASKEVADYLYFDEENVIIEPNSNVTFKIELKIPANMKFGNYSGTILVKIYRVK